MPSQKSTVEGIFPLEVSGSKSKPKMQLPKIIQPICSLLLEFVISPFLYNNMPIMGAMSSMGIDAKYTFL